MEIRDRDGGGDLITRISRHDRGDVPGNCRLRIALGIASDREVVTRNLAAPDHWQSSMRQFFMKIWTEGGYESQEERHYAVPVPVVPHIVQAQALSAT